MRTKYNHPEERKQKYLLRSPAQKEAARQNNLKFRKKVNDWFKTYKMTCACQECGESDPRCLDFHHRDPATKVFLVSRQNSIAMLKAEIAKCDVLCANCHRKLHLPS